MNEAKQHHLQSQIATAKRRTLPYVLNEQGVAMLSAVLNSDTAIETSIKIIDAFVQMRKVLINNALLLKRLDNLEHKQLSSRVNVFVYLNKDKLNNSMIAAMDFVAKLSTNGTAGISSSANHM